MTEPTMETLARRLDRMERENRRMKQVGVVALAVIAAVVLMGHVVGEKVVEAERFVLLDSSGQPRAVLAVAKGGSGLYLYDRAGKVIWSAP